MPTTPDADVANHKKAVRHRRVTAALTLVTLVTGGTAFFTARVWPGFAVAAPVAVPAVKLLDTGSAPLAIEPQPRIGEQTPLIAALPDVAGVWVQSGIVVSNEWQPSGVVEAWTVTYHDGTPVAVPEGVPTSALANLAADPAAVEVTVGQWQKYPEAAAFFKEQTKDITHPLASGEVKIAETGEVNGKYYLATTATGQGVIWWRNNTVVIKAVGAPEQLAAFFSAFPL